MENELETHLSHRARYRGDCLLGWESRGLGDLLQYDRRKLHISEPKETETEQSPASQGVF